MYFMKRQQSNFRWDTMGGCKKSWLVTARAQNDAHLPELDFH